MPAFRCGNVTGSSSAGPITGKSTLPVVLEYFAGNTEVLCRKYRSTLREVPGILRHGTAIRIRNRMRPTRSYGIGKPTMHDTSYGKEFTGHNYKSLPGTRNLTGNVLLILIHVNII